MPRCFFNKATYTRKGMVNAYFQVLFLDSNPQWHVLDISYIAIPDVQPCYNSVQVLASIATALWFMPRKNACKN